MRTKTYGSFDLAAMADAISKPGIDPRSWVSIGIVEPESAEAKSVNFDEKVGPLISVRLVPNGTVVNCRVSGWLAGNGESVYFPFIGSDEVVVLIPGGNEREGCVIIGRLNNGIDVFPDSVAGLETKNNNFGFMRLRTPFIVETAGRYMIRSAVTGAFFLIDEGGNLTFSGAGKAGGPAPFLHIGADFIGFQDADANLVFQLGKDGGKYQCTLKTGEAFMSLGEASTGSGIKSPGTFYISASGFTTIEHALSTESFPNFLNQIFVQVGIASPGPLTGVGLAAALLAAIPLAAPIAAVAPLLPTFATAIKGSIGLKPPNPLGTPPGFPGIGCPGLQIG